MQKKHVICYVNRKGFYLVKGKKYSFKKAFTICFTRNITSLRGMYFPFPIRYAKFFFEELQGGKGKKAKT